MIPSCLSLVWAIVLTDATLSVGPDTNEATIQRLYEGLLGRGNDTGVLRGVGEEQRVL